MHLRNGTSYEYINDLKKKLFEQKVYNLLLANHLAKDRKSQIQTIKKMYVLLMKKKELLEVFPSIYDSAYDRLKNIYANTKLMLKTHEGLQDDLTELKKLLKEYYVFYKGS